MGKEDYMCPICGEILRGEWNYNEDTGELDFECPLCGWEGTENEVFNS